MCPVVEPTPVQVSFLRLPAIVFGSVPFPLHDPHPSWPFVLVIWLGSHLLNVVDQALPASSAEPDFAWLDQECSSQVALYAHYCLRRDCRLWVSFDVAYHCKTSC